jgi:hypothetical protein
VRGDTNKPGFTRKRQVKEIAMSVVERKMAEMALHRGAGADTHEKGAAVRIPLRYVQEWSVRADSKNGGRVELVLDGVPISSLLVLVNELKGA